MIRYKMRAECVSDVGNAIKVLAESGMLGMVSITAAGDIDGDVEIKFAHAGNLAWVRRALGDVQDGHCMLRTVARAKDYTGEQYYFDVKELHG